VDISAAIASYRNGGKLATLTAVQPPGLYGALNLVEGDQVAGFQEKPQGDGGWINGGFFVLEPGVFDTISSDATT
jgi:glucose-1-phosphate cytidylyltransferase